MKRRKSGQLAPNDGPSFAVVLFGILLYPVQRLLRYYESLIQRTQVLVLVLNPNSDVGSSEGGPPLGYGISVDVSLSPSREGIVAWLLGRRSTADLSVESNEGGLGHNVRPGEIEPFAQSRIQSTLPFGDSRREESLAFGQQQPKAGLKKIWSDNSSPVAKGVVGVLIFWWFSLVIFIISGVFGVFSAGSSVDGSGQVTYFTVTLLLFGLLFPHFVVAVAVHWTEPSDASSVPNSVQEEILVKDEAGFWRFDQEQEMLDKVSSTAPSTGLLMCTGHDFASHRVVPIVTDNWVGINGNFAEGLSVRTLRKAVSIIGLLLQVWFLMLLLLPYDASGANAGTPLSLLSTDSTGGGFITTMKHGGQGSNALYGFLIGLGFLTWIMDGLCQGLGLGNRTRIPISLTDVDRNMTREELKSAWRGTHPSWTFFLIQSVPFLWENFFSLLAPVLFFLIQLRPSTSGNLFVRVDGNNVTASAPKNLLSGREHTSSMELDSLKILSWILLIGLCGLPRNGSSPVFTRQHHRSLRNSHRVKRQLDVFVGSLVTPFMRSMIATVHQGQSTELGLGIISLSAMLIFRAANNRETDIAVVYILLLCLWILSGLLLLYLGKFSKTDGSRVKTTGRKVQPRDPELSVDPTAPPDDGRPIIHHTVQVETSTVSEAISPANGDNLVTVSESKGNPVESKPISGPLRESLTHPSFLLLLEHVAAESSSGEHVVHHVATDKESQDDQEEAILKFSKVLKKHSSKWRYFITALVVVSWHIVLLSLSCLSPLLHNTLGISTVVGPSTSFIIATVAAFSLGLILLILNIIWDLNAALPPTKLYQNSSSQTSGNVTIHASVTEPVTTVEPSPEPVDPQDTDDPQQLFMLPHAGNNPFARLQQSGSTISAGVGGSSMHGPKNLPGRTKTDFSQSPSVFYTMEGEEFVEFDAGHSLANTSQASPETVVTRPSSNVIEPIQNEDTDLGRSESPSFTVAESVDEGSVGVGTHTTEGLVSATATSRGESGSHSRTDEGNDLGSGKKKSKSKKKKNSLRHVESKVAAAWKNPSVSSPSVSTTQKSVPPTVRQNNSKGSKNFIRVGSVSQYESEEQLSLSESVIPLPLSPMHQPGREAKSPSPHAAQQRPPASPSLEEIARRSNQNTGAPNSRSKNKLEMIYSQSAHPSGNPSSPTSKKSSTQPSRIASAKTSGEYPLSLSGSSVASGPTTAKTAAESAQGSSLDPVATKTREEIPGFTTVTLDQLPMPQAITTNVVVSNPVNVVPEETGGGDTEDGAEDPRAYTSGGYHPTNPGEIFDGRFKAVRKLGWGEFSVVWLARDLRAQLDEESSERRPEFVALKISKSAPKYRKAALAEMEITTEMKELMTERFSSPQSPSSPKRKSFRRQDSLAPSIENGLRSNEKSLSSTLGAFEHTGPNGSHVVMVMELCGPNLLKLMQLHDFRGLPLPVVKCIITQVLQGAAACDSIGLIHCDMKPENILFSTPGEKTLQMILEYQSKASRLQKNPIFTEADLKAHRISMRMSHPSYREKILVVGKATKKQTTQKESPESGEKSDISSKKVVSQAVFRHLQTFYSIKVADFGTARFEAKVLPTKKQVKTLSPSPVELQTLEYRAPEIVLGFPEREITPAIDTWSIACITFELITGAFLFDPKAYAEDPRFLNTPAGGGKKTFNLYSCHLSLFSQLIGPPPASALARGTYTTKFFKDRGDPNVNPSNSQDTDRFFFKGTRLPQSSLAQLISAEFCEPFQWPHGREHGDSDKAEGAVVQREVQYFVSFLEQALKWDPKQRAKPEQLLKHPWLKF